MKLTATQQETILHDIIPPDTSKTFGTRGVPRYLEPSMFDLLSFADCSPVDQPSDYKSRSALLKDRINKSNDPWKSENRDNYRPPMAKKKKKLQKRKKIKLGPLLSTAIFYI